MIYNLEWLRQNPQHILLEVLAGSHSYGTALPTSDRDTRGVFILPQDAILGLDYVEQTSDDSNDTTLYELKRFLELVQTNNPNILELLSSPTDCILYKHPVFDLIIEQRDRFVTKACRNSFGGYAIEQIRKARGLNKKIVNPIAKERKTPLDFCYVVEGERSYSIQDYLSQNEMEQRFCGLAKVPHARDLYALFYDWRAHECFSELRTVEDRKLHLQYYKAADISVGLGYKGIIVENSDDIRLSSIPKGEKSKVVIYHNEDGFSSYCREFREYWDWDKKKNPVRYNDNISHGKNYDGKNLLHCHRLLDMALEILGGKGIIVRRPNREQLLSIRKGEYDYDQLITDAETKIKQMDELFEKSTLPDKVNREFVHQLLVRIRKEYYDNSSYDLQALFELPTNP